MSDEQTEHTEMTAIKASMRAVTEERNRLRAEVNTWKEQGATWEASTATLTEQVSKLQGELNNTKSHHEQDLQLSGLGICELERIGEVDEQSQRRQPVTALDLPDGALEDAGTLGELVLVQLCGQAQ